MLLFGDPIIDGSALWKIIVAALIGGCGIVVVYGFLLLGIKYATTTDASGTQSERSKLIGYTLAAIRGLAVLAVIVLGVYAMTKKSCPTSTPARGRPGPPARRPRRRPIVSIQRRPPQDGPAGA